jgi:DNA polymerase III subunit alpha
MRYDARMKPEDFVHLHCHSTYSLLEALPSPEEIVLRAKELGQSAVGIADKGHIYGLIECYQYAEKHGVKPILGMEALVAARTRTDKESGVDTKSFPLTLLCETQEGYENLLKLATARGAGGHVLQTARGCGTLGEVRKGIDRPHRPDHRCHRAGGAGGGRRRIRELTEQYRSWFGPDNVYFELMDLPQVAGRRR